MMGIYNIVCEVTSRTYVGSARILSRRLGSHISKLRNGKHHCVKMQQDWNEYGVSSFTMNVLETVQDVSSLIDREQYWIDQFNSTSKIYGYNLAPATGMRAYRHSDATRLKVSLGHMGRKHPRTLEWSEKIAAALRGRSLSKEHKKNISKASRGKPKSEEMRERLSATRFGMKFGPLPEETKDKISVALRGRSFSEETRARISAAKRGCKNPRTPEWTAKIAAAQRGIPKKTRRRKMA